MEKLSRLTPEDRDNLAAYIDGELDDENTHRIERVLTENAAVRNEYKQLVRAYDMLDLLPHPVVSSDFTQKTVATAIQDGARPPFTQTALFRKLRQPVVLAVWSCVFVAIATAGYATTNRLLSRDEDQLLRDLPVIRNLDAYHEIESVEFLELLAREPGIVNEIRGEMQP